MTSLGRRCLGAVLLALLAGNAGGAAAPAAWVRAAESSSSRPVLLRAMAAERFRGGFEDMVPLANALLSASAEARGRASLELAGLAAAAAPRDARPHLRLLALGVGERQPASFFARHLWGLASATAGDPWAQARLAAWAAAVLWAAAFAAAGALGLAALPTAAAPLFHDYRDAFPRAVRRYSPAAFAAVAALVAVGGGGVGPLFACGALALALAAYLPPRGRWALGLSLCLTCLAYPSLSWVARPGGPGGGHGWALYRVSRGDAGAALERELGSGARAEEAPALVARSLVARRALRYGDAEGLLRRALAAGAAEGPVRLELGNLAFAQGRYAEAQAEYERAAAAAPQDPRPWLNLHVVHLKRLALAEADRALERAKALDSGAAWALRQAQGGESAPLLPVSGGYPASWVRQALWAPGEGAAWPGALWRSLVLDLPWSPPGLLAALALLATWALGTKGRERLSRRCPTCGAAVCPRCGRRVKGSDQCLACWSLRTQKVGDAAERARQQQVMAAWSARGELWRRLGGAALPGWAEVAHGGGARALAGGLLWSLAAGAVLVSLLCPVAVLPSSEAGFSWGGAALLLLLHLDGLRRAVAGRAGPRGG